MWLWRKARQGSQDERSHLTVSFSWAYSNLQAWEWGLMDSYGLLLCSFPTKMRFTSRAKRCK